MNAVWTHPRTWPIWDVLFPPLCTVCERPLDRDAILFCAQCWADAPTAELAGVRKPVHVDLLAAGFRYAGEDVVRASVHALKYRGMRLVAEPMSRHLVSRLPIRFVEPEVVWTPVPLHWRRWLSRGYNQSAILARALADTVSHESPRILLRRRRNTPTQTARSYRERHANVRNAFEVPHGMNVPEAVLLIDDVITTGATVEECARVLKDAGAKWVGAFAFGLTHNG